MAPSGTMTAIPPLPPDVQGQVQQQPQSAAAMFGRVGASIPDPISVLEGKMQQLEEWAADTAPLLTQINPALATLMTPIAQAGKAMQSEIANLKQRTGGQSPQVTGSVPPNVPGNIPSGRPAM
jgi:hypothetical protein